MLMPLLLVLGLALHQITHLPPPRALRRNVSAVFLPLFCTESHKSTTAVCLEHL